MTPTPTPAPVQATPAPAPRVTAASLQPTTVSPGASLTATVDTEGSVGRVQMYLGSGSPNAPAPISTSLTETSAGTWTTNWHAPSQPGVYHFTVGIYHEGHRTIVDNDGWNIQVTSGSTAAATQPLPDNIPLAPPFSYGDPVPTVFEANGESVHGSEITSNTRPDVPAGAVAQFYTTRLPRAGWTVADTSVPTGATSFTISATITGTDSTQVCVVQYSASTVHIFYGSILG